MKWITREHPRVDRVACPWLVQRFVDKAAEFVYVPTDRVAAEATKTGAHESELPLLAKTIADCQRLRLVGLMMLPPFFEEAEATRPFFRKLRELRDELASQGEFEDRRGELSMGMTHDYEIAIEEGATIVRVGTAIFGERGK